MSRKGQGLLKSGWRDEKMGSIELGFLKLAVFAVAVMCYIFTFIR